MFKPALEQMDDCAEISANFSKLKGSGGRRWGPKPNKAKLYQAKNTSLMVMADQRLGRNKERLVPEAVVNAIVGGHILNVAWAFARLLTSPTPRSSISLRNMVISRLPRDDNHFVR
jgi:hypothetical protein